MAEERPELKVRAVDAALGIVAAFSVLAAVAGLPLYADGAHYLFRLLVEDGPYVPDGRFGAVVMQLPALAVSRMGGEVASTRLVFATVYASLPVLSLLGCWLVLRRRAPSLMLFVGLAALLGQLNFSAVSELLVALYLTWPVALALAVAPESVTTSGLPRAAVWASGPLLVLLHPLALFALLGLGLLAAAMGRDEARRSWWALAAWFGLCAGARALLNLAGFSGYESAQLTGDGAAWYLLTQTLAQHAILASVSVLGLLAAWEAVAPPSVQPTVQPSGPLAGRVGRIASMVIAVLTIFWSHDILWGNGIRLKSGITFVTSLLLLACAVLVALRWRASGGLRTSMRPGWTGPLLACLIGVACLTGVKTAAWWTATRGLQNVISDSTGPCIRHAAQEPFGLQWPWMAIVDEWNAPMNALLFRPGFREPGTQVLAPIPLLLPRNGCERLEVTGLAYVAPWLAVPWQRLDALFGPLRPPWFRSSGDAP
jgi:hypothetical protein